MCPIGFPAQRIPLAASVNLCPSLNYPRLITHKGIICEDEWRLLTHLIFFPATRASEWLTAARHVFRFASSFRSLSASAFANLPFPLQSQHFGLWL
jgi:hypothetical protein